MGARDGAGGQYRSRRSPARSERPVQRGHFRQQFAGRVGRLDELGSGRVLGRVGVRQRFHHAGGHNGVTFVASSGDSGTTEYPSASPNVLAVGGTTLNVDQFRATMSPKRAGAAAAPDTVLYESAADLADERDSAPPGSPGSAHDARRVVGRQPVHRRFGLRFGPLLPANPAGLPSAARAWARRRGPA